MRARSRKNQEPFFLARVHGRTHEHDDIASFQFPPTGYFCFARLR